MADRTQTKDQLMAELTALRQQVARQARAEERLVRLNECFLNFGANSTENINRLTALLGQLFGATCALYNRLDEGLLCATGQWNTPPDYNPVDKPDGHICYDVIKQGGNEVVVVRNLPQTTYAQTDSNVRFYQLQTYVGKAVKCDDEYVGSLCAVFQNDFPPSEEDKTFIGILASAIGVEEERRRAEEALKAYQEQLEQSVQDHTTELSQANQQLQQEIIERKRTEEALRLKDAAIATSINAMAMADLEGNLAYVNNAFLEMWGYNHEQEVVGRSASEFWQLPKNSVGIVETLWNDGSWLSESVARRKDGSLFNAQLSANMVKTDETGDPICIMASFTDITERKQAEESIRQHNRELALLNQLSQTFVSTLDLDEVLNLVLEGVRQALNVVACSAWLTDPETNELVCRQVTDPQSQIVRGWRLAPGQGIAGWVAQHGQSLNVPNTEVDDRHFKGVDLQTGLKLRSILSVPLRVKKGVIGVLQIVDETQNRFTSADLQLVESLATTAAIAIENAQLYEAAQELQKQTQQDAETKTMLLKEVNHRVKNNLAAIAGMLYIERRHAKQTTEQRTYQALIEDLINRIEGLATVHRLLSASQWSPVALDELVEQIIYSALQTLLPDKRVITEVSSTHPLQVAPREANNLAMVINELATNVVKYALLDRQTVRITVRAALEDELIFLEFRDDGPGYPEAVLNLEQQNVGLYLIQNIICSDMQGELTLSNDHGAVTTIRFPMST